MEALITRVGKRWYTGDLAVRNGQPVDAGNGWTFTIRVRGERHVAEVFFNDELQYSCIISRAERLWLFSNGAAEVIVEDAAHKRLAQLALSALAARGKKNAWVKVGILPRGKTINGNTFRTRMGANNYFSDGQFQRLSQVHVRISMRCIGGSYLVQTHRHDNLVIFAVEITAQTNYHEESLERCLRNLA